MSSKTKTGSTTAQQLGEFAQQLGLLLMTAAVTFGMAELPDHGNSRVVLPNQPVFAWTNNSNEKLNNPIRRENEETEQQYISYSEGQRTATRSGHR